MASRRLTPPTGPPRSPKTPLARNAVVFRFPSGTHSPLDTPRRPACWPTPRGSHPHPHTHTPVCLAQPPPLHWVYSHLSLSISLSLFLSLLSSPFQHIRRVGQRRRKRIRTLLARVCACPQQPRQGNDGVVSSVALLMWSSSLLPLPSAPGCHRPVATSSSARRLFRVRRIQK